MTLGYLQKRLDRRSRSGSWTETGPERSTPAGFLGRRYGTDIFDTLSQPIVEPSAPSALGAGNEAHEPLARRQGAMGAGRTSGPQSHPSRHIVPTMRSWAVRHGPGCVLDSK
jgi:hypothetical protein